MPLTGEVEFVAVLQRGNRIQIHRTIRWRFKLEPDQALKVWVYPVRRWTRGETFYGHMNKDGRITVPLLTRRLLVSQRDKIVTLEGEFMKVRLDPV